MPQLKAAPHHPETPVWQPLLWSNCWYAWISVVPNAALPVAVPSTSPLNRDAAHLYNISLLFGLAKTDDQFNASFQCLHAFFRSLARWHDIPDDLSRLQAEIVGKRRTPKEAMVNLLGRCCRDLHNVAAGADKNLRFCSHSTANYHMWKQLQASACHR